MMNGSNAPGDQRTKNIKSAQGLGTSDMIVPAVQEILDKKQMKAEEIELFDCGNGNSRYYLSLNR